eukprot:40678_1
MGLKAQIERSSSSSEKLPKIGSMTPNSEIPSQNDPTEYKNSAKDISERTKAQIISLKSKHSEDLKKLKIELRDKERELDRYKATLKKFREIPKRSSSRSKNQTNSESDLESLRLQNQKLSLQLQRQRRLGRSMQREVATLSSRASELEGVGSENAELRGKVDQLQDTVSRLENECRNAKRFQVTEPKLAHSDSQARMVQRSRSVRIRPRAFEEFVELRRTNSTLRERVSELELKLKLLSSPKSSPGGTPYTDVNLDKSVRLKKWKRFSV